MNKIFFKIQCKTNLHVGSGQANYGVVDNLVQRDPTSHYPTIHASSLKGAIKEYCHHSGLSKEDMKAAFGSCKDESGKTKHTGKNDTQVGEYKFFDANLLAIPVRCDRQAYVHVTCPMILEDLSVNLPAESQLRRDLNTLVNRLNNITALAFSEELNGAVIEDDDIKATFNDANKDWQAQAQTIKDLFNCEIVVVSNNIFDRLTNDLHLPVIARNYLENGESKNLWYEQVVPRLSLFWSMCLVPKSKSLFTEKNGLKGLFNSETETMVQIGANGSIGYGYCNFKNIKINQL